MVNRQNNFGSLRLAFASLVIAAHTPELLDGNQRRELLMMLFGTTTFGGVAVSGFFLISGYLITRSMAEGSLFSFSVKRIARIVPGFMVAFWLCVLVLAPVVTAEPIFSRHVLLSNVILALKLDMPWAPNPFPDNHYHALNGAMWTIAWEFLCYIGLAILGITGLLKSSFRWFLLAGLTATLIVYAAWTAFPDFFYPYGDISNTFRFFSVFGVGAIYYLFRDKIRYTGIGASIAGLVLFCFMFYKPLTEPAVAVFGGYIIFWFAFTVRQLPTNRMRNDISYGIYLYGWPVGQLIIMAWPQGSPWVIGILTLAGAALLGFLSWKLVEGPAMDVANGWLANRKAKAVLREAAS